MEKRDRAALEADGFDFNIHLIVGGQIAGLAPEVHLVYPQGNSIHATRDCPFLQIGERNMANLSSIAGLAMKRIWPTL